MHASLSERTWRAFCAADRTLGPTPGLRARWHAGRPAHAVWLVRVHDPVVAARARALQAALAPWLVPLPVADMHITLRIGGFGTPRAARDPDFPQPDHVDLAGLRAVAAQLSATPPRVTIGGANAFTSAAFLEVQDPHGDLARIRARLAPHGADETRSTPWLPHLTVGTWAAAHPTAGLAARLRNHRSWPPWPAQVSASGLAMVDTEDSTIQSFHTESDI